MPNVRPRNRAKRSLQNLPETPSEENDGGAEAWRRDVRYVERGPSGYRVAASALASEQILF
ncbi:MAG: hypothetical protein R3B07_16055 [Polyangiaceae bacterium]